MAITIAFLIRKQGPIYLPLEFLHRNQIDADPARNTKTPIIEPQTNRVGLSHLNCSLPRQRECLIYYKIDWLP